MWSALAVGALLLWALPAQADEHVPGTVVEEEHAVQSGPASSEACCSDGDGGAGVYGNKSMLPSMDMGAFVTDVIQQDWDGAQGHVTGMVDVWMGKMSAYEPCEDDMIASGAKADGKAWVDAGGQYVSISVLVEARADAPVAQACSHL